jgi:hypothetical protein
MFIFVSNYLPPPYSKIIYQQLQLEAFFRMTRQLHFGMQMHALQKKSILFAV